DVGAHWAGLEAIRGSREVILHGRPLRTRRISQALVQALNFLLVGLDRCLDLCALAGERACLARRGGRRGWSAAGEVRGLSASRLEGAPEYGEGGLLILATNDAAHPGHDEAGLPIPCERLIERGNDLIGRGRMLVP